MGKNDKDRYQKELAVRYCLARGMVPFPEVLVPSAADLSDAMEILTDIDVLGIEATDSGLRRTLFDCKSGRMSAINRAFWAAGVSRYAQCDSAIVILKDRSVSNHRLSALEIGVDLHDEASFVDTGKMYLTSFPGIESYQSDIENWNLFASAYERNPWAQQALFSLTRNLSPLSHSPWNTFRKIIGEIRNVRGQIDPAKDFHTAIFLDILASCFVLWATMSRDIRRFYVPTMQKEEFETILRYYVWGGKESYAVRMQMRELLLKGRPPEDRAEVGDLPAWSLLFSFVGIILSAPQHVLDCANYCRELAFRLVAGPSPSIDAELARKTKTNPRLRQFSLSLSQYLVAAGNLPKDMDSRISSLVLT